MIILGGIYHDIFLCFGIIETERRLDGVDWMDRLNAVIEYIEDHLNDEIDFDVIAQKSCCSYYNFQRLFSFIFNTSLSEYIRNRKLTLAAIELQNGKIKVVDVALKYGYESQEAFSRAFAKFHGVPPSRIKARSDAFKTYSKAVISMNERVEENMGHKNFVLEKTKQASIFEESADLMGWMRFSITTWSYLEFIGQANEPWPMYALISSLCGEAFSPANYTVPASGIKTLFKNLGFKYEVYSTNKNDTDYLEYDSMKKRIVEHISQTRRPVILCNNNAINLGSRGIIIGYENEGDKLVYWGRFPFLNGGSEEPINIPVENWYADNTIITLIGERATMPKPESVYASGVKEALFYLCDGNALRNTDFYNEWKRVLGQTPDETINELKLGENKEQGWSLFESSFDRVERNDEKWMQMLGEMIDPLWCDFALRRACAAMFLDQAKAYLTQIKEPIEEARKSLMNIHDMMGQYPLKVGCVPGESEAIDWNKFADPNVRSEMIGIVERCCCEEQQAVTYLKKAVNLLNVQT